MFAFILGNTYYDRCEKFPILTIVIWTWYALQDLAAGRHFIHFTLNWSLCIWRALMHSDDATTYNLVLSLAETKFMQSRIRLAGIICGKAEGVAWWIFPKVFLRGAQSLPKGKDKPCYPLDFSTDYHFGQWLWDETNNKGGESTFRKIQKLTQWNPNQPWRDLQRMILNQV